MLTIHEANDNCKVIISGYNPSSLLPGAAWEIGV